MFKGEVDIVVLFLIGTALSLLFVVAIVAFVMQYYKRALIYQQEMRTKELEKERDLLLALMEGREHEQQRLAEELHDGLAVDITVINQQLYILRKQLGGQEQYNAQLNTIKEMLITAGENVRAMSHNLTPANIEKFGLVNTLTDMIAHINRSGEIKAELHTEGIPDEISKGDQLIIYRIIQELIQNIHKHAAASMLSINIAAHNGNAVISVADDGKGLPAGSGKLNFGIGLTNIQSRAKLLNGAFHMSANMPKGTIATLQFAYKTT